MATNEERIQQLRKNGCGLPAGRDLLDHVERNEAWRRARRTALPPVIEHEPGRAETVVAMVCIALCIPILLFLLWMVA